jgi:alkylhydroperoxidase family enzyme
MNVRAVISAAEEANVVVPDEDKKQAGHRALVDRVLNEEGKATAEQRARAFSNSDVPPPLDALIGKVATSPTQITDADFAAAKAAGFSEDQLFELVIAAAVGQSARQYETALAALDRAAADGEAG